MPALAPTPTLRLLSLFFPTVTNTSLKTSFTKWMDSKAKSHAHAKEQSSCNTYAAPSQTSQPDAVPRTRPFGPSDFLPPDIENLDFIAARNAAWVAFQQWQRTQDELRVAESEKVVAEQAERVAEASVKRDIAYADLLAANKAFNAMSL